MTAYFDDMGEKLSAIDLAAPDYYIQLTDFEHLLVSEVTVCSEFPGFPEDLRTELNLLLLAKGISTLPIGVEEQVEPEGPQHWVSCLHGLTWDIHTLFHKVAMRHLDGFSDSPLTPLRCLAAQSEERREVLASVVVPAEL